MSKAKTGSLRRSGGAGPGAAGAAVEDDGEAAVGVAVVGVVVAVVVGVVVGVVVVAQN